MFYILKLYIHQYQQFKNFVLDLTYSEGESKGMPMQKVCLIGKNGTGKSTLMSVIEAILNNGFHSDKDSLLRSLGDYFIKVRCGNKNYFIVRSFNFQRSFWPITILKESVEDVEHFEKIIFNEFSKSRNIQNEGFLLDTILKEYVEKNNLAIDKVAKAYNDHSKKLLITVPAESNQNTYKEIHDVPSATVNDALSLFNDFPYKHIVSSETINQFWKTLIFLIKKRESDNAEFRNLDKNQDRTIREVNADFEKINPKIIDEISKLWDIILEKGGLEFDSEKASNPIQLNDNLKAYIKIKSTGDTISYNRLSTGIRDFIFKLGHVFALYFGREVKQGYLILDEPENSLFPDILYELVDLYIRITKNTQLFISTHSPIVAAQFKPNERIILDFAEDGSVTNKRGTTPVGDDPNDILTNDFGIRSLLDKEGIKKWERYIELKFIIKNTANKAEKFSLMTEYMAIGNAYNFGKSELD